MNTKTASNTASNVAAFVLVDVSGYGIDGSGPCAYTVRASSVDEKDVAEAFASAYPEEARWGFFASQKHQCCPALIDKYGACPECGGTVPNW